MPQPFFIIKCLKLFTFKMLNRKITLLNMHSNKIYKMKLECVYCDNTRKTCMYFKGVSVQSQPYCSTAPLEQFGDPLPCSRETRQLYPFVLSPFLGPTFKFPKAYTLFCPLGAGMCYGETSHLILNMIVMKQNQYSPVGWCFYAHALA